MHPHDDPLDDIWDDPSIPAAAAWEDEEDEGRPTTAHDDTPVTCARCCTAFPPLSVQLTPHKVAYGCASHTHKDGTLRTGYGSAVHGFDAITIARHHQVPKGMLCDGCVSVLIASQALLILQAP